MSIFSSRILYWPLVLGGFYFQVNAAEPVLDHHAYIWQREWSSRVEEAILREASEIGGVTVLMAELYPLDPKRNVRIPVSFDVLKRAGAPVTVAIRVNWNPRATVEDALGTVFLDSVVGVLEDVRDGGLDVTGIEIDFDCPTSKLELYAERLVALRSKIGKMPLSVTTLPTWMERPDAFLKLVSTVDRYVLQVHSIQRPVSVKDDVTLCDPKTALRWIQAAGESHTPFRVALPTYGYRLGFSETGELAEVSGEDASVVRKPGWTYRVVRAKPVDMARLVRALASGKPTSCTGVIWYRLPVGGERLNWDPGTWRAVKAGRIDEKSWKAEFSNPEGGVVEVVLIQTSELAREPPDRVRVSWSDARAVAWDGQRYYSVRPVRNEGLEWIWPKGMEKPLVSSGERWTIGWIRLDGDTELKANLGGKDHE